MCFTLTGLSAGSTATALWGPKSVKSNSNNNSKNNRNNNIKSPSPLPLSRKRERGSNPVQSFIAP